MKPFHRLGLAGLMMLALTGQAQPSRKAPPETSPAASVMDGELFYQILLGEISARGDKPGDGYALILDAARKTNDATLYQRAVEIAIQSRSGDAALQAARAWKQAQPTSREANRHVLQVLVALNRLADTVEPLRTEIALADAKDRSAVISIIPRHFARASDKKLAASVVEQALAEATHQGAFGPAAWTTIGRMRLSAGDANAALDAAAKGQAMSPNAQGPVLLALEMMDPKQPQAEALVRRYIDGQPVPEIRMGYARALLDVQRYAEASAQLKVVTAEKPEFAEAWLVLGTLQVQDNLHEAAQASLKRYVELALASNVGDERSRGLAQAYLSLAQIAERNKDYASAGAWLDRIENSQDLVSAQHRRASILARQGKLEEARTVIRSLPERNPAEARSKLMAEVQLLRENKQYKAAYDLLAGAKGPDSKSADTLYDQAMLAEKMGSLADMERLLREAIALKPDFHHAYNALGYSFAERNIRLQEAKQLIQKALEYAPGDPFISDSLGWVEFRLGNKAEALRILTAAYKERPDAEIAAHLGEVLWSSGQRERALAIWREGLLLNTENETLRETLKRLRVKL